jgi:FtsZ-interacting cell division protein ZipA
MPELRWTLLILGALFIVALAIWELRRQRHARGEGLTPGHGPGHGPGHAHGPSHASGPTHGAAPREGERLTPTFDDSGTVREGGRVYREPTLTFPDADTDRHVDRPIGRDSLGRDSLDRDHHDRLPHDAFDRDPMAAPPVVEMDDPELTGLRIEEQPAVDEFSEAPLEARRANIAEPMIPELSPATSVPEPPEPDSGPEGVGPVREYNPPAFDEPTVAFNVVEPVVDWPDEDTRRIVALRLVANAGGRFSGRSVRLALSAEGFFLGKFDIFHKPAPDGRAVLSVASLNKPGTFSLSTMDAQRYGGISLFAVLPGPLPPGDAFDELLTTARSLNDRLRGALQDERGEPLTPVKCASIRDSLTAAASAAAPVVQPPGPAPSEGSSDNDPTP